jgi:D-alanyl-D-alanine dipeptidase/carboxypeptidase
MKKLCFSLSDVSNGHLILVNPSHPIKENLKKNDLVSIAPESDGILLEKQTAKMLTKVISSLGCEEHILPISGYRTLWEQRKIFKDSLLENGEDFTRKYVAVPGCSEHQTGLAVDLAENRKEIDYIRPFFPYSGVCGQFRKLSVQYGFIERYPAGRENITYISHEPWHFRYVGYPHSVIITEKALTLEEYTDYLKGFSYEGIHLRFVQNGRDFETFYIPVLPGSEASAEIPDETPYQISGNNEDGVLVTLWRV